jgi:hypothetical protein
VSKAGVDLDRLAQLEEERSFLLRSLADLEREHDAGDVDEHDYETLRDGYTARAADVIRSIDSHQTALPPRRPVKWSRIVMGAAAAVIIGVGAGVLITRSSAEREPGQSITGDAPGADQVNSLLVQARSQQLTDPAKTIELYTQVLQKDPENVEALTYRGWTSALVASSASGEVQQLLVSRAVQDLDAARAADPTYPDAQCFTAIVRLRLQNDAAGAREPYDKCVAGDLPDEVKAIVQQLGSSIAAGATTATTAPATTAP